MSVTRCSTPGVRKNAWHSLCSTSICGKMRLARPWQAPEAQGCVSEAGCGLSKGHRSCWSKPASFITHASSPSQVSKSYPPCCSWAKEEIHRDTD